MQLDEAIADGELIAVQDAAAVVTILEALIQGSIFQFSFLREAGIERHLQAYVESFLKPYRR